MVLYEMILTIFLWTNLILLACIITMSTKLYPSQLKLPSEIGNTFLFFLAVIMGANFNIKAPYDAVSFLGFICILAIVPVVLIIYIWMENWKKVEKRML